MRIESNQSPFGDRPDVAIFSDDDRHRYHLTREFGRGDRPLIVCGLNPSTATAFLDDQTIRKEIGFAKRWGCGRLVKVNAYGFRATDPKDMKRARRASVDVVGPENNRFIREAVQLALLSDGIFLVAWGANIEPERQRELAEMIGPIAVALLVNKDGSPGHPLYIAGDATPSPWQMPRTS